MLFNTIDFAIFLPLVFLGYWFIFNKSVKAQNLFLLVASYIFYGWWDPRFLLLILTSTFIDFWVGQKIQNSTSKVKSKGLLILSLTTNLGLLAFFKYFNFFQENFVAAFSLFNSKLDLPHLNIILPVGISFYTFQTLSYTIDVYRKKIDATSSFISFGTFVSFFPQLVAGPIERASNMLPQINEKRTFKYIKAVDGSKQILWGLFKKVVIADNIAPYVTYIFENHSDMTGSTILLGIFLFAFQVYGDFSGYSDIAIGVARLFGFNLQQNFAFPYFSRSITEFWRRWHISLTTWIRDYIYIPLGGNKTSTPRHILILFIVFVLSGLWHGANWTFILWGALNALFFIPSILIKSPAKIHLKKSIPEFKDILLILRTFTLIALSLILFRAENLAQASGVFTGLFTSSIFSIPSILPFFTISITFLFIGVEWQGRANAYAIQRTFSSFPKMIRYSLYYVMLGMIYYSSGNPQDFIYFQF